MYFHIYEKCCIACIAPVISTVGCLKNTTACSRNHNIFIVRMYNQPSYKLPVLNFGREICNSPSLACISSFNNSNAVILHGGMPQSKHITCCNINNIRIGFRKMQYHLPQLTKIEKNRN
jgi:hypothetical protein